MSDPTAQNAPDRPPALVLLVIVVVVEALATAVVGLLALIASPYGVRDTGGGSGDPTSGVAVAVFVLVFAVLLGAVAAGLLRRRSWTRAATLVWQLVQALVGAYSLQGAGAALGFGVAAIGLALLALVLLFSRPVRAALDRT